MKKNEGFKSIADLINIKRSGVKPPAYQWQDLALKIITDFRVPNFKRSSVFKICKDIPKNVVQACVDDTKELCQSGEQWKYFFKLISESGKENKPEYKPNYDNNNYNNKFNNKFSNNYNNRDDRD